MDFRIDKEHENFILKVREFTEKYVKPAAAEVDRKAEAPIENIKKMGEEGLMGVYHLIKNMVELDLILKLIFQL